MTPLDLTSFYGLDTLNLNADELETVRTAFGFAVAEHAIHCRTNSELLDCLILAMPPESGLQNPRLLGQGSTRTAWSLPFGLVLKLQRTGELSSEEMKWRGSRGHLDMRRRIANLGDAMTALIYPRLTPNLYGVMLSFGQYPVNVSALVTSRLTSLEDLRPDDRNGVGSEDLYICPRTGELIVLDERFKRPHDALADQRAELRLDRVFVSPEPEGVWTGNLGRDEQGRHYLLDSGGHEHESLHLNHSTFLPEPSAWVHWKPCGPLEPAHKEQTITISRALLELYRHRSSHAAMLQAA